ncbi:MAG TPA: RrF2 family transcriptional regulator [Terriglobales bacterium]|nr:RrF2 family transcriptional regulator [Terriglobales bacterium]
MMVSTRGRYALRVMVDLAENDTGAHIPLRDIADRQEISRKYLENIMAVLSKAGFVDAVQGKGGGYKLSRAPDTYTVGSVLKLTEGSLAPVACLGKAKVKCHRAPDCRTLPLWRELDRVIDSYLEGITVADLVKSPQPKALPDRPLHSICAVP